MYKSDFKTGDIITFCGNELVVLKNYGISGMVQENCKDGAILKCYWEFQGEKCILKANGIDNRN